LTEDVEAQHLDAAIGGGTHDRLDRFDALYVAGNARQAVGSRPAAVAVHDDRDMTRSVSAGQPSDLHHFGFLVLAATVDRLDESIVNSLQGVELAALLVLGDLGIAERLLELVRSLSAVMSYLDARLLGPLPDLLDHLAAPFLGEGRHAQANDGAIDVRHQADVAAGDGLVDRRKDGSVPRLD